MERVEDPARGTVDYLRTQMAVDPEPAMDALGEWAHRHMRAEIQLHDPGPDYLMWNLRRKIDAAARRVVVRFRLTDPARRDAARWLISRPGTAVDLCVSDPGFEVDLFLEAGPAPSPRSGWAIPPPRAREIAADRIFLTGDPVLATSIGEWVRPSGHAAAPCRSPAGGDLSA